MGLTPANAAMPVPSHCPPDGITRLTCQPMAPITSSAARQVEGGTCAALLLQAWGDVGAPGAGFGPIGDVRLLPAPDAELRGPLPWYPTHAIAISEMHETPGMPHTPCMLQSSSMLGSSPCPFGSDQHEP